MFKSGFHNLFTILVLSYNALFTMELIVTNSTHPEQAITSIITTTSNSAQQTNSIISQPLELRYRPVTLKHIKNILLQSKPAGTEFVNIITQKLKYPYIGNNGRIYGFISSDRIYKFHACDGITGNILWYIPAKMDTHSTFVLWDNKIYLTLENKNILIIDALSGDFVGILEVGQDNILELKITDNGTIYIYQGNYERQTLISLNTVRMINYAYSIRATRYSHYLIGESLGIIAPFSDIIEIFDPLKDEPRRIRLNNLTAE